MRVTARSMTLTPAGLLPQLFLADRPAPAAPASSAPFEGSGLTTELLFGARALLSALPALRDLRRRCDQEDDLTTDPHYFVAANTQKNKRVAAVLVRRNGTLEAYVFFVEHCSFGLCLGSFRGGDYMGQGLVVGCEPHRTNYVHLATQALLRHWRTHSISFTGKASLAQSLAVMGTDAPRRLISQRDIQHTLPLESTYHATLAAMGPRTRRSLAGKRRQLEQTAQVVFLGELKEEQSREAMGQLARQSISTRIAAFYDARLQLMREHHDFFCMGLCLPDGTWLSIVSGWRRNGVTYVDLQMNDRRFKKESISAVMRAFLLEHEIDRGQRLINFVGGSSLLLRRYCRPTEQCTDVFLWRPGLRAALFRKLIPHFKPESVYVRVLSGHEDANVDSM